MPSPAQHAVLDRNNPWPDKGDHDIVFILDAANRFEQDLLEQWVSRHRPQAEPLPRIVRLKLGNDRRGIDAAPLLAALNLPEATLMAPLRVVWRPPDEDKHTGPRFRDLVLGDPRGPKRAQARKILEKSPERVHLVAGIPGTLAELRDRFEHQQHEETTSDENFAGFIARQAALALDMAERRLQGGRYKVPRHVAESLRTSKAYLDDIDALAEKSGKSRDELLEEAAVYMKEMISIPSTFWLDIYAKFNNFWLQLGYEEQVVCNPAEIERMRSIVRDHPAMLLWTHKTYVDGAVLPKVLYDNDCPMAHMFGGANMGFAGLGYLARRAGGIFIRRSFQDNELYKLTLRHYISLLMEKRFPMNWSFEGTRSRMGKLMPPRYGLLKYVLEACHGSDARNIHIIPISISYDLIRDVEEYASEQTGRNKKPETLRWFIGYLRSLARPMGKVYMDIGEPVVLDRAPDPDDAMALSKIAFEVAVEANRVTPITFPSLVTMSLLGAAPRAQTEQELVDQLTDLLAYAEARNLHISPDFDRSFADQMEGLLGLMIDEGIVTRYDQGPEIVYGIAPEQHPVASYYRNMVIHFFVDKAIVELALLKANESESDDVEALFWEEVDRLRDLFKYEFFYPPSDAFREEIREELQRYSDNWQELLAMGPAGFLQLLDGMQPLVAHTTLLTYVEAYRVVSDLLARLAPDEALEEKPCVEQALKHGQQAYLQRRISSAASIGKILFQNGFKMLENRQLTAAGDESLGEKRLAMARELRDLARRIDRLRGIAVASSGSNL